MVDEIDVVRVVLVGISGLIMGWCDVSGGMVHCGVDASTHLGRTEDLDILGGMVHAG